MNLIDPHPAGPSRFLRRRCAFDAVLGGTTRRLVGIVEDCQYIGRTESGSIPDYRLSVRGSSGALIEGVSLVESRASFQD